CEGSVQVRLHSVTLEWGYEPRQGYCYGSISVNNSMVTNLEFEGEGYFGGFRKPLFKGYAAPPIPVVSSEVIPYVVLEAKGSIGGGFTSINSAHAGIGAKAGRGGLQFFNLTDKGEPQNTLHFTEMEATITGGVDFRTTLSVCMVMNVFGGAFIGLELKGKYDPMEQEATERPESVHDCEVCIDGSLAVLLRVYVGANVGLPGQPIYVSEFTLAEPRFDAGGFYISFGKEGLGKPEWGLGECPHRRWRTDVFVFTEEGSAAESGKLTAQYADGRSEEAEIASGSATVYLPAGDNKLTAKADGQRGTAHAVVGEAPVETTIRLAEQRQVFLVWSNLDEGSMSLGTVHQPLGWFPDLVELFLQKYPDAILVDKREWTTFDAYWSINETAIDTYDLAPGDIVILLESRVPGMITRRWLHDGTLGGISSGSAVGMAPADLFVRVSIIESPNAWITEEYLAALSEEEREEALRRKKYEVREIRLCDFWTDLMLTDYYSTVINAWGDREEHLTEFSVRFVDEFMAQIYDEDYQVKSIEGEDGQFIAETRMLYEETIWHGDITKGELFNEENGYAVQWSFARQLVPYAERAFDYIDMILENEWNSYVQLLPGGEMRLEDAP
ncbi:MAG: hypothetical protein IJP01_00885, partial [Oscillospiraceae bacterium]|nr:hypothetical protein [Oscillospiraceae bacterium]